MANELAKVIDESGLDKTKATILLENFSNYFEIAADWESKAKALEITSIEQKAEMKMAREGRLFLREKRIAVEKTRKALKENALREGQTIDAIAKILTNLIIPIEEELSEKEKYAEIQEAKRKAALKAEREMELEPYMEFVPYGLDFGDISDENYIKVLDGAKLQHQAKLEADAKAEAERIAREKAEAEERERIRVENEKLKAEAEKNEMLLAKEREKAEAERKALEEKARAEREEAERKLQAEKELARQAAEKAEAEKKRLEAEIEAKKIAEENAKKEAEAKVEAEQKAKLVAERKAKNAPDKVKLLELAIFFENINLPEIKSEEGQLVIADIKTLIAKTAAFIRDKSEKL